MNYCEIVLEYQNTKHIKRHNRTSAFKQTQPNSTNYQKAEKILSLTPRKLAQSYIYKHMRIFVAKVNIKEGL